MSPDPKPKSRAGGLLFAILFLVASLYLISQIGDQTKFSSRGKLFAQPAFWPSVGVIGMAIFGVFYLISEFRNPARTGIKAGLEEGLLWLRPLEYLVWFLVYVKASAFIGYLPATLIFTGLLALRVGYRSRRMILASVATGLGVVLVFKTFLSVNIPGGALYEYFPDAIRSFMIVNF